MLNKLWLSFFLAAAAAAFYRWLAIGDAEVFRAMIASLFDMARVSVEVMVLLFGTLTLWLGFLRIAEGAGLVERLARLLGPLFARLMPEVPRNHPAIGLITLNFAANGLGLDNAATPIGLRAMRELQSLNPKPDTASNAQILFLVLNASSLTLLPVSLFMFRAQQGAADPTLVFLPILLATCASTLAGFLAVAFCQRLKLTDPVVLAWLGGGALALGGFMALLASMTATAIAALSSLLGNLTLFCILLLFLLAGAWKRCRCTRPSSRAPRKASTSPRTCCPTWWPCCARWACCGPRARSTSCLTASAGWPRRRAGTRASWTPCPPPWSSPFPAAARALMLETMTHFGVDSFPALLATVVQGSTETTFYVLAVYFGSVGILRARHAVACALVADAAGVLAAIGVCYWFFG